MMGFWGSRVLFIIKLSLCLLLLTPFRSQFVPANQYSIDCGSPTNTTVGNRIFLSDNLASGYLTTPQNVLVDTSAKSIPSSEYSLMYQTARIFSQSSTYSFKINRSGRHWIRLFFFPFSASNYNLKTDVFSVATRDRSLLSDFRSVNLFAFINGLEVVSVPNPLMADVAVTPPASIWGLVTQALETVARVNMGGPMVTCF